MNVSYDQFHSTVQSIPESATLGEASVQFVAAVADLKAKQAALGDVECPLRPHRRTARRPPGRPPHFWPLLGDAPAESASVQSRPDRGSPTSWDGAEAETSDGAA